MATLGHQIRDGHDGDFLHWIIPGKLACAHRPLRYDPRYGGSRRPLPLAAASEIETWAALVREYYGIKSIIALWHDGDLACYRSLPLGDGNLITYLERAGFTIAHHPYEDPAHKKTAPAHARATLERIRHEALQRYDQLDKPVLIMCSAGEDRSAPVAAYIHTHRAEAHGKP